MLFRSVNSLISQCLSGVSVVLRFVAALYAAGKKKPPDGGRDETHWFGYAKSAINFSASAFERLDFNCQLKRGAVIPDLIKSSR